MKITVKKMGGAKVEVAIEDTVRRLARARARHLSPASPLPWCVPGGQAARARTPSRSSGAPPCVACQMTVADLKAELLLELDVAVPVQRLLLKGKPLGDDAKPLREYGVVDGSNLTLQVKKESKPMKSGFLDRAKSAPTQQAPAAATEPALGRAATGPASDAQARAAAKRAAEQEQATRACIGETYSALAAAAAAASADHVPDYQFAGSGADVQTELAAALEAMAAQLPTLDPLLAAAGAALGEDGGAQSPAVESLIAPLRCSGKALAALGSAVEGGAVLPARR